MAEPRALSVVTNVSRADAAMVLHTVPSWLRVLDGWVTEVVVLADLQPPSGRIAQLHGGEGSNEALERALDTLAAADPRVRVERFDAAAQAPAVARRWFRRGVPVRCQGGTPVAAMLQAIGLAREPLVLRADSDMVFAGSEWVAEGAALLREGQADLVEPPRHGMEHGRLPDVVSTRAFMLMPDAFAARLLPMRAHRVGALRRIHRALAGRAPWLSLEEMLQRERAAGRLRHRILRRGGFSIHAWNRKYALLPGFADVVAGLAGGRTPAGQPPADWNLVLDGGGPAAAPPSR